MLTSGPSHRCANLMSLRGCLPQHGMDTTTFGRTGEKNWFQCWTLWVLPVSFYPPFTVSFTSSTLYLLASSPSTARCTYQMQTSVPGKTYLLLLYSSLVKTAYFRNRKKTHFANFMNIILFHRDQHFGKKYCLKL